MAPKLAHNFIEKFRFAEVQCGETSGFRRVFQVLVDRKVVHFVDIPISAPHSFTRGMHSSPEDVATVPCQHSTERTIRQGITGDKEEEYMRRVFVDPKPTEFAFIPETLGVLIPRQNFPPNHFFASFYCLLITVLSIFIPNR